MINIFYYLTDIAKLRGITPSKQRLHFPIYVLNYLSMLKYIKKVLK
jgi:hypothetical protein